MSENIFPTNYLREGGGGKTPPPPKLFVRFAASGAYFWDLSDIRMGGGSHGRVTLSRKVCGDILSRVGMRSQGGGVYRGLWVRRNAQHGERGFRPSQRSVEFVGRVLTTCNSKQNRF